MRIRFLHTTSSDRPDLPFQAGQIIHTAHLTAEMRKWLDTGVAMLMPDEPEAATGESPEQAVAPRARKRRGSS